MEELNLHVSFKLLQHINPANTYLPKSNNRNTGKRCEVCSKLIIKTPERRQLLRSGFVIVNFEHIYTFF